MGADKIKKYLLFCGLFLISPLLFAGTHATIFSAYTYINDLGLSLQDAANNSTISRSGIKLGAQINWQNINYQGGTSASLFVNQDTDLNDNRNIRDVGFNIIKLQALSASWLLRSQFFSEQYQNEVLLSTGFNGLGAAAMLGYMGEKNSGIDIGLKWFHENHQQDAMDQYKTERSQLSLQYYVAAASNTAQWSVQLQLQNNQANDEARDYVSHLIGVSYKNWRWNDVIGNLSLQRREDNYRLSNPTARMDQLNFIALDLFKPLNKHSVFSVSLSGGFYDSNQITKNQTYLQINIGLQTRLY